MTNVALSNHTADITKLNMEHGNTSKDVIRMRKRISYFLTQNRDSVVTAYEIAKKTKQSLTKVEHTLQWFQSNRAVRTLGDVAVVYKPREGITKFSSTWITDSPYKAGMYVEMVRNRYKKDSVDVLPKLPFASEAGIQQLLDLRIAA